MPSIHNLKQKGMNDGWYKYNANGTLIINNFSAIEILLTKVSSVYGSNEACKISFDHYKAMFGYVDNDTNSGAVIR